MTIAKIYPIHPVHMVRQEKSRRAFLDDGGSVLVEQERGRDRLRVRGNYSLSRAAEIILEELVKDMPKNRAISYLAMLSANALKGN